MKGGGGARSGGERRTPPEKVRGLGFKDGSRCYVTFPCAQRLTGAAIVYGGAASRAGRAVPTSVRVGERHVAGTDFRGTPECGLTSGRRYA
jgi:hypothetical protein